MNANRAETRIAVSSYDRAAGWVISLNLLVGSTVLLGFLIWLSPSVTFVGSGEHLTPVDTPLGRGDHEAGHARDVEAPGVRDLEEAEEPRVERLLDAVTLVVATQIASLDAMPFSTSAHDGAGDNRPPGPPGDDDSIPRGERWKMQYNATSQQAYAQQLDFFEIELGVLGGGVKVIDYARDLNSAHPNTRQGPSDQESRLYMAWTSGELKKYDLALLSKTNIETTGRMVVHFYPRDVEERLAKIEQAFLDAANRKEKELKETLFDVRKKDAGFEYYVVSQKYRDPRP